MQPTYIARLTQELAVAKALGGSPVERTELAVANAATEPVVGTDTKKMLHFGEGEGTFDECVLYHTKDGHDDESARRICGRIQTEQEKRAMMPGSMDSEKLHDAAQARSKKHGIPVLDGGHLTPPSGGPKDEADFADPVNFMYPMHDKAHADNAHARFTQAHEKYPESAKKVVFQRIVEAQMKHGSMPHPSEDMMHFLPEELQDKLTKKSTEKIEKSVAFSRQIPIRKVGNKRELFGVIYPANRIDAQNEYTDETELRKAAHLWLADSRVVNIEHTDETAADVVPVESYLAPSDIAEIEARKSDWCGRFMVKSDSRWQEVEQGVFTGWSIEGICDKQHEPNGVKKMVNLLVTKVSLVRNPANRLSFVAKGQSNKETKHMEPIKTTLEAIQKSAIALSKAVEAERVEFVPSFAPVKDEAEGLAKSTSDQAQYVLGVLVAVEKAIAVRNEVLAKSAEVIKEQQDTIHELSATVEALRGVPDVMEAEKLAAALDGGAK